MLILTVVAVAVVVDSHGIGDRVLQWAHPTSELADGAGFIPTAWIVLILIGSAPLWTASMAPIKLGTITAGVLVGYMFRWSTRHKRLRDFRKIPVTRRSFLHGFIFCGTVILTAKTRAFSAPLPPPDPVDSWWLIPEQDISWWPQVARPTVLGEQLYIAHDIGPRGAPEPDALQGGATAVSTFAALQAAVNAARPGDVIALKGGTRFDGTLLIPNIGTADSPVIIRADPTDEAQAIIFGGLGYTAFITPGTAQWELYDADKKIWRSTSRFARRGSYVIGHLIRDSDGAIIYLFPYLKAHFFSSSYGAAGYRGPGVYHDDSRLYIRLENPDEFQSAGLFDVIPEADDDPNDLVIYVGASGNYPIHVTGGSAFFRIEDIITWGGPIRGTAGGSGWDFVRCQMNTTNGGFSLRNASYTNISFSYGAVRSYWGQWLDREEHKSQSRGYRPRTHTNLCTPIEGTTQNIWFEDSRITDLTDGILAGGSGHNCGVRRCYQRYIDDMTQIDGNTSVLEFARNHVYGPGFGWGSGNDSADIGSIWIHHNVFNCDWGILWRYAGMGSSIRPSRSTLNTHGDGGDQPLKFYNNTVIGGGFAVLRTPYRTRTAPINGSIPHYVLNNVLYQSNTRPPSSTVSTGGNGAVDRDLRVDGATDRFNGNAWGKDTPHGGNILLQARRSPSNQAEKSWPTLAAFKADTSWSNGGTYAYETDGSDIVGGRDAFVDFAAGDFQPKHDGSIAGMTPVDLEALASANTHGWQNAPELDSDFVGAIPPRSDPLRRERDRLLPPPATGRPRPPRAIDRPGATGRPRPPRAIDRPGRP